MRTAALLLALCLSPLAGGAQTFKAPLALPRTAVPAAPALTPSIPALGASPALPAIALSAQKTFAIPPAQAVPTYTAAPVQGQASSTFQPYAQEPKALLPDGTAIPPDSYLGGFHGAAISPDEVVRSGGFTARGPQEDWRLKEHSEGHSQPQSAFRGTTPFVTAPDGQGGAAAWADEGGWVYELHGVPTWDVNGDLEGRVETAGGWRGNLMHGEHEQAVPAKIPIECIVRWGQVSSSANGTPYVRSSSWTPNPRYDLAQCLRFWGASALPSRMVH